ncbi:MAG: LysM peptidoglycan-binding domain-containing protein [Desulfobacterales bacterium]
MFKKRLLRVVGSVFIIPTLFSLSEAATADHPPLTIEQETGYYYTVRRGDTLWDLSGRFFGAPSQWPELWKENRQIRNPHWIFPGDRIRLFQGSWRDGSPMAADAAAQPSPAGGRSPLSRAGFYTYPAMDRIGFIREEPLAPFGTIFKSAEGKMINGTNDLVYIKPATNTPLAVGSRFTTYRIFKPLVEKTTRKEIGVQHYLTGVVEITQSNAQLAVGKIVRVYREILVNDHLIPYQSRSPEVKLQESLPNLSGKLIISEENSVEIGDDTIAFIDKGEGDGIQPGQVFTIYEQQYCRMDPNSKEMVALPAVDFGKCLVLHTEKTTATVLITEARRNIQSGFSIRATLP